ncbi:hypothetical protein [Streptomyces noursei]|uniref:hypothetical protein n=1 Tax=Streptomyces noursei TaxID=1971 RepID=UPI00167865A0|nr:hypothetical protein [Streptomyces noursei]MCZ1019840.1 hypothetical protein [Streptomyces noursei]GGX36306.1 hypothetical protein GCM10010341_67200 [Streptomyces noursei]
MEGFEIRTGVTLARPAPNGTPRPFGEVRGYATDPITGKELVMVLWIGAPKPLPHDPDELTYID